MEQNTGKQTGSLYKRRLSLIIVYRHFVINVNLKERFKSELYLKCELCAVCLTILNLKPKSFRLRNQHKNVYVGLQSSINF